MSTSPADFNAKVIDEFRANGGRVGGVFEGMPIHEWLEVRPFMVEPSTGHGSSGAMSLKPC